MQEEKNTEPKRWIQVSGAEYNAGEVLYFATREMRVNDNPSLLFAESFANARRTAFAVAYNLETGFLGGSYRSHAFKVKGLKEFSENLEKKNIPFFLFAGQNPVQDILEFILKHKIGALVIDFCPLHTHKSWLKLLKQKLFIPIFVVDSHNIVPAWIVSKKQEYGAYTLRPKITKLLSSFLKELPKVQKQNARFSVKKKEINWEKLLEDFPDKSVPESTLFLPGEKAAKKFLLKFLENKIGGYAEKRNDPGESFQSNLSPYLHYGQISALKIALEALKLSHLPLENVFHPLKNSASSKTEHLSAFLEELIVRRELADNFCFYNDKYDSVLGFTEWAQKSLHEAKSDKREYIYTKKEFEEAKTHDDLWNACQREMKKTGKMHGYMRMYWAKKILEWTKSPEEALKIAIYLNDKYELDGRDPNGYTGIAWSIGGVHDRAWFPRKIFGLVRYMARSGCDKKFDTKTYIKKWLSVAN